MDDHKKTEEANPLSWVKKRPWIIVLLAILALGVIFYFSPKEDRLKKFRSLDKEVSALLKDHKIDSKVGAFVKEYSIHPDTDIENFKELLEKELKREKLQLLKYQTKAQGSKIFSVFEIGRKGLTLFIFKLIKTKPLRDQPRSAARKTPSKKVAIVIDDWGYNINNIELLDSIEIPLTLSILPNLPFSYKIASSQSHYKNREIIMHMPMEPEGKDIPLEKNTLMVSMNEDQALGILKAGLKTVPKAKGISNHMGSLATQDKRLIGIIMKDLKEQGLYFLDSLATPYTICQECAARAKVRFAKRDTFLDNQPDKEYISSQLDKLIKAARVSGSAVGVGHDRTLTLQVIKMRADDIIKKGDIEFVLLSELVKRYE